MRTILNKMYNAVVLITLLIIVKESDATTYYSRTSGQWNLASSWSTVTYGDPTNTGTYPITGDMVYIGDGHTILLASSSACSGLDIGQGTSGILEYPNFGTITLSISGALTINNGGKLWYNYNNSRTHNLFVSGDVTNNGILDLYSDANDYANMVFNGAASCNITGTGTFAFNLVTISKATRSYYINVTSAAFLAAAPPSTALPRIDLVKGTFVCNTATTTSWSDPVATSYTIPMDVILEVRTGTVNMLTAGDTLINSGKIYITGGILEVGSSAGKKGILNRDAGSIDPEVEITAGTLKVYGGLSVYTGSNPWVFKMTGGNLDLNSGSTRTDGYPLYIPNISGSQFVMTGGNIYIRKPSTTAATVDLDFGSSNVYHNVTDGHIYFGDGTTAYAFDYMPYVSYGYPHMESAGISGTSLKPSININSKMLSLKVGTGNTFDISSAGTNGTSTQITLTGALDGFYALYNEGTFQERTGQIVMSGTVPQYYYSSTGEYIIHNLTVNNTTGIHLDMPLTIAGTLTLTSGIIYSTSTNIVTFNNGSSVTGASNTAYIDGPARKVGNTAFTFPIGKSSMYRPVTISAPSAITDSYTAEYLYTSPDPTYDRTSHDVSIDHISNNEYWTLDRDAGTSNVNVTLNWTSASGGVDDLTSLRVAQWDGSAWRDQGNGGTTGTVAAGTITTSSASSSFGPFTLGSSSGSNNPLPVELTSFTVKNIQEYNILNWVTASEKENDYFEVEKSHDGINYITIAKIKGAGTTNITHNYDYADRTNGSNVCYRLKQTDFNGDYSYSDIKCISGNISEHLNVYPTIINNDDIHVNLNESFHKAQIKITDVTGRIIYSANTTENNIIIKNSDVDFQSKGIYFITVITETNVVESNRIIKI